MANTGGGNVGIGTTTPYSGTNVTALTINATSYPTLSLSIGGTNSHVIMGYSTYLNIDAIGNRSINLRTNDTDRLSISGSGTATFSGALKISYAQPAFDLQQSGTTRLRMELDSADDTYLTTYGSGNKFVFSSLLFAFPHTDIIPFDFV